MTDRDAIVDLTHRLVSIPSHHDPDDGVDETAAGDAIEAWLREHTDAGVQHEGTGPESGCQRAGQR